MNLPEEIRLNSEHDLLKIRYVNQEYHLPAEFLRVYSPSAEVRGHGIGQETLQTGKRTVTITDLEAVGNYALKIAIAGETREFDSTPKKSSGCGGGGCHHK